MTRGLENVAIPKSSSVDIFGLSARTSSGRGGPSEGSEKVFKAGNSYSQWSKQASQGLAPNEANATISTSKWRSHVQGARKSAVERNRCLMKLPQLHPLRWSDDFLRSGATLTCCRRKRASLFIQVTGTRVVRHCSRCSHGRLTLFSECVQTALDQQLWLNGYTPQPIESDLLELASKYDHLEPHKNRTQKSRLCFDERCN